MAADGENILAAFTHAVDTHELDLAIKLLESTTFNIGGIGFALRLPVEPVLTMPGVQQHPGYPLVLMTAAFAADARGEPNRAQQYGDAALDAEHALTAPRSYTLDLSGTRYILAGFIAFSTGAWDEAAAAFLESAEQHRRANRMAFVASSLSGAASALCYSGRFADAVPIATEGLAVARANGVPTQITVNLVALAMALSRQEPDRARALLVEASHQDIDYEAYTELTQMTLAAAMIRDWPLTARFATRSIPHAHWLSHRPFLHALLTVSARALADTDPEAAATIQGAVHTLSATLALATTTTGAADTSAPPTHRRPADRPGLIVETRRDTTRLLIEALGDKQLHARRDHGATLDTDTVVAYTLSRLNTYLTNTPDRTRARTRTPKIH
jgi:hypothetical protein